MIALIDKNKLIKEKHDFIYKVLAQYSKFLHQLDDIETAIKHEIDFWIITLEIMDIYSFEIAHKYAAELPCVQALIEIVLSFPVSNA